MSDASETKPEGEVKTELTAAQLKEFIKRQKLKISKLEAENKQLSESLANAAAASTVTAAAASSSESVHSSADGTAAPRVHAPLLKLLQSQRRRSSLRLSLATWRTSLLHSKLTETEQKLEEATKNLLELEKRCLKLKGLLSRTHQANKQQAEDTNAFKRAQREATQELRNHAMEKLALIEEVRARDIESAFHQDLEIYIQKAAEGLVSQQQQMQQQNIQSQGTVSKAAIKEIGDENERLKGAIRDLQTKDSTQSLKLKETMQQLAKAEKLTAAYDDKVASFESRIRQLDVKLKDEISLRRDVEVELDLTLKSRTSMVNELETASEAKLKTLTSESQTQISELRSQCDALTKSLATMQDDVSKLSVDNGKLRKAAQSSNHLLELEKLRARVVEYKQLLKSGTIVPLSGGEPRLQEILESSVYFASQAKRAYEELHQARTDGAETSRYLRSLYSEVLKVAGRRLTPFTCEADGASPYFARENMADALKIVESLKAEVALLNAEMSRVRAAAFDPMVWEASSVTIQAGKDMTFAIPMPQSTATGKAKLDGTLEWMYAGPQAGFVTLTLLKPHGKPSDALSLQSLQGQKEESSQFKGNHRVSSGDGDRLLKLSTSSMWGPVTISYYIRLSFDSATQISSDSKQLANDLELKSSELALIVRRVAAAAVPLETFRKVSARLASMDDLADDTISRLGERFAELNASIKKFNGMRGEALRGLRQVPVEISTPLESVTLTSHLVERTPSSPIGGDGFSVLNCESLKIRASDDFRVYIPPSFAQRPFKLQWAFELISGSSVDIGFTVLEQQDDGALPTLIPYRRVRKGAAGEIVLSGKDCTLVVLFDNSYSWARSKELKCSVQVTPTAQPAYASGSGLAQASDESPARRLDSIFPSGAQQLLPRHEFVQLFSELVAM